MQRCVCVCVCACRVPLPFPPSLSTCAVPGGKVADGARRGALHRSPISFPVHLSPGGSAGQVVAPASVVVRSGGAGPVRAERTERRPSPQPKAPARAVGSPCQSLVNPSGGVYLAGLM